MVCLLIGKVCTNTQLSCQQHPYSVASIKARDSFTTNVTIGLLATLALIYKPIAALDQIRVNPLHLTEASS